MRKYIIALILFYSSINAATIYVKVYNVKGNLVANAYVKLYDNNWNIIDSNYTDNSGMVTFALLDYGTYSYEVYYTGESQEFWGSDEGFELGSPTIYRDFTRNWPYKYSDNLPISNVAINQSVELKFIIKNDLTFSRNVKVQVWIDKNKSASGWKKTTDPLLVDGQDNHEFKISFTPESSGEYYYKYRILTYNDGAKNYIATDSYFWNDAFSINQSSLPTLNGMIVFHTYTSYFNFDGILHILDLSKQTLTDLSFNNWDGCTNPSLSPDGEKIVFMAVPSSSRIYDSLELVMYNLKTGHIKRLTDNSNADEDPKFCPNGVDVVFKRNKDLYKINVENGSTVQLTSTPSVEEWAPFYSADGAKIFYTTRYNNNDDIWQIDSSGQDAKPLLNNISVNEWYPQTIDNKNFLYTISNNGDNIYKYNLSNGISEYITTNSTYDDSDPFYIYDNYFGFSSNRDGNYDLFLGDMQTGEVWKIYDASLSQSALGGSYLVPSDLTNIDEIKTMPASFLLSQNYPNPFNPITTISYQLPEKTFVTLKVYDLMGREIDVLVNEEKPFGYYTVNFNARDYASGVYYYRIQAGDFVQTKKMVLLK